MLVIFEMPTNAAALGNDLQEPRNPQGSMIQWQLHEWIGHIPWLINATAGKNQNPSLAQTSAKLLKDCFVFSEWSMPDAVPRRNQIVLLREVPTTDVGKMKNHLWMALLRHSNHLRGNIYSLGVEALANHQINNSSATTATNVDGSPLP